MGQRPAVQELSTAIEAALLEQSRALIAGDWRVLTQALQRQEALLEHVDAWPWQKSDSEALRRLRRSAQRNAELARRLAARVAGSLRGPTRGTTYTRRARLGSGARSLLSLRG